MSSYLHRLAAAAINPVPAIRPVVRPLFAPAPVDPLPPYLPDETNTLTRRETASPPASTPDHDAAPDIAPRQPASPGSQVRPDMPAAPMVFQALIEPPFTSAALPGLAPGQAPEPLDAAGPQRPAAMRIADAPGPEPALGLSEEARIATRLQIALRTRIETPALPGPTTSSAASRPTTPQVARGRSSRQPPAAATPPPRPADEIQIHIGRIDVTAVPLAAPPPQPRRPPRVALNLSDYLKNSR